MVSPMQQAARDAFEASRALRRLPADLKKAIKADLREEVAEPLAGKIRSAVDGPYAAAIGPTVKTKLDTVPRISIGAARKAVSGGASVRQLVYGTEFGGGKRETMVTRPARNAKRGRTGRVSRAARTAAAAGGMTRYRRASTNQFVPARPFAFATVRRERAAMLEGFGRIVDKVLEVFRSGP